MHRALFFREKKKDRRISFNILPLVSLELREIQKEGHKEFDDHPIFLSDLLMYMNMNVQIK